MTDEVRLWRIGAGESLTEIGRASLDLEARLQEWLAGDISMLDPGLLAIGREVATDFGGYIDLLCIDASGDLVIVELKRDKTPREITAQALDYASWVADLSNERVTSIAETYLGVGKFDSAFRSRFGEELPETLNGDHQMLIVGSLIDESSERIITYLSDKHGVNINAATFQYFREPEGSELVARVFLMEPSQVEERTRNRGSSKRRPNLTEEQLTAQAEENGVLDLYALAVASFERQLQKRTSVTALGLLGLVNGGRKVVVNLLPGQSSASEGLRYIIYRDRFAALAGIPSDEVINLMPASHERYIYYESAGPDYEGFQGFIKTPGEIERLAMALQAAIVPRPCSAATEASMRQGPITLTITTGGYVLTQDKVPEALPILVQAAQQRQTMTYKELGDAIGIHHRSVNWVLGHIRDGICVPRALPLLTCLVVNRDDRLPGESWLPVGIPPAPTMDGKRQQFEEFRDKVFSYPGWDAPLEDEHLEPLPSSDEELAEAAKEANRQAESGHGAESEEHKRLKQFVHDHPEVIGESPTAAHIEHQFLSGDRVDVAFEVADGWATVEVKTGALGELVRGVYQAVKYRALAEAQYATSARTYLVSYSMPGDVKRLAKRHGILSVVVNPPTVPGQTPDGDKVTT